MVNINSFFDDDEQIEVTEKFANLFHFSLHLFLVYFYRQKTSPQFLFAVLCLLFVFVSGFVSFRLHISCANFDELYNLLARKLHTYFPFPFPFNIRISYEVFILSFSLSVETKYNKIYERMRMRFVEIVRFSPGHWCRTFIEMHYGVYSFNVYFVCFGCS